MTTPDEKGRSQQWKAVIAGQLVPGDPAHAPDSAAAAALRPPPRRLTVVTDPVPVAADGEGSDVEVGVEEQIDVADLQPGDLVLVSDNPMGWGLVESKEPDLDDEDLICIDWRGDTDDAGSMAVPNDSYVTVRRCQD